MHLRISIGVSLKIAHGVLGLLMALFWTGVNAVGYFLKAIGQRKGA
jgi:hypothetical protein